MKYIRLTKFIITLAFVQLQYRIGWRKLPHVRTGETKQ